MILNSSSSLELLTERYPDLAFFLHLAHLSDGNSHVAQDSTEGALPPFTLFIGEDGKVNAQRILSTEVIYLHDLKGIDEEVVCWKQSLHLNEIEVLYVYGLGLGYYYESLKEWLQARKDRVLIFIEDDLGAINAFLKMEEASEVLKNPQVHLAFIPDKSQFDPVFEELTQNFPSDRIELSCLYSYRKQKAVHFEELRLMLFRKTAAMHALLSESLYGHRLFANLLPNFKKIPESFYANQFEGEFKGTPAIICGAGPSLSLSFPILKNLQNRALIIAGGSGITALTKAGIQPHFAMALDPNLEEYQRLRQMNAFETPFLFASRLFPKVFSLCNGSFGYMRSDTGGAYETWMEKKFNIEGEAIGPDLGREAFSVTTLAVAFAYKLRCDPIILIGVDLAYTGMQRYAGGVVDKNDLSLKEMESDHRVMERVLERSDRQGNKIYTLVKWIMESECLSLYAKNHEQSTFINATEGGLGFADISYKPLEKVVERYCLESFDLRGKIHALIEKYQIDFISNAQVTAVTSEILESLERCLKLSDQILEELSSYTNRIDDPTFNLETRKMILFSLDLENEVAFECLLQPMLPAIELLFKRCYPLPFDTQSKEYRQIILERAITKWQQAKIALQTQLSSLSFFGA